MRINIYIETLKNHKIFVDFSAQSKRKEKAIIKNTVLQVFFFWQNILLGRED
jgi:hypothetical protein